MPGIKYYLYFILFRKCQGFFIWLFPFFAKTSEINPVCRHLTKVKIMLTLHILHKDRPVIFEINRAGKVGGCITFFNNQHPINMLFGKRITNLNRELII